MKENVILSQSKDKSFSIKIYNLLGAEVYNKEIHNKVGNDGITIDVSSLQKGVYTLVVSSLWGDAVGRGARTKIIKE